MHLEQYFSKKFKMDAENNIRCVLRECAGIRDRALNYKIKMPYTIRLLKI